MKLTLGKCGVVAWEARLSQFQAMPHRLARAYALIDAANARDPTGQAELYGRRMTETLEAFTPDAPETLKLAARAQHIERWTVPRSSYPEGRVAYLTWRKDLQKLHARRAGEIMAQCGYSEEEIARLGNPSADDDGLGIEKVDHAHEAETEAMGDPVPDFDQHRDLDPVPDRH